MLSSLPFLKGCGKETIEEIFYSLEYQYYQKGDIIISNGSQCQKTYLITEGLVQIKAIWYLTI